MQVGLINLFRLNLKSNSPLQHRDGQEIESPGTWVLNDATVLRLYKEIYLAKERSAFAHTEIKADISLDEMCMQLLENHTGKVKDWFNCTLHAATLTKKW